MKRVPIPTAADIMHRHVQTIPADTPLEEGVRTLLRRKHSGAPVLDAEGRLVGVLSEYDCLAALSQAAADGWQSGTVADHMTAEVETVAPTDDVFALSTKFRLGRHRRLLVVDKEKLVGLISRRDLLSALESIVDSLAQKPRSSTYDTIEKRHIALD